MGLFGAGHGDDLVNGPKALCQSRVKKNSTMQDINVLLRKTSKEVFFLRAARSNCRNLHTYAVSLNMCCLLVCLLFLDYLHGALDFTFSAYFEGSEAHSLSSLTLKSIGY